jgi:hypothetical protein
VNGERFRTPERRHGRKPDTGHRRREVDPVDEFNLFRDKVLLVIGGFILLSDTLAAIFLNIKNPEVAIAVATAAAGFLGAPSILRLDERRGRRE